MDIKEINDDYITALTLWREGRGIRPEAVRSQAYAAIFDVIRTRAARGRPKAGDLSPAGVCLEPWQFSCHNLSDPNCNKFPLPAGAVEWEAFKDAWDIIQDLKKQPRRMNATHYHTYPEGHKNWPSWATPSALVARVGPLFLYDTV